MYRGRSADRDEHGARRGQIARATRETNEPLSSPRGKPGVVTRSLPQPASAASFKSEAKRNARFARPISDRQPCRRSVSVHARCLHSFSFDARSLLSFVSSLEYTSCAAASLFEFLIVFCFVFNIRCLSTKRREYAGASERVGEGMQFIVSLFHGKRNFAFLKGGRGTNFLVPVQTVVAIIPHLLSYALRHTFSSRVRAS